MFRLKISSNVSVILWFCMTSCKPPKVSIAILISMGQSGSVTFPIVRRITGEFCPRLIMADGGILYVSSVGGGHLFITSDCIWENRRLNSVVLENGSGFERIDRNLFSKTGLRFLRISASREECFSECRSLTSVIFETGSRLSRIERRAFRRRGENHFSEIDRGFCWQSQILIHWNKSPKEKHFVSFLSTSDLMIHPRTGFCLAHLGAAYNLTPHWSHEYLTVTRLDTADPGNENRFI
jgi:hypothetical protein